MSTTTHIRVKDEVADRLDRRENSGNRNRVCLAAGAIRAFVAIDE